MRSQDWSLNSACVGQAQASKPGDRKAELHAQVQALSTPSPDCVGYSHQGAVGLGLKP